jgi:hypothetical protein
MVPEKKPVKRNRDDFVSIPRASVVCSICADIIHAPHHLSCACMTSFCETCIVRWVATHDKCPVCNTKPKKRAKAPIPCGRQWGDAMDSIKRACPMHADCRYRRGCYDDTRKHAATECIHRKVACPNEGCDQLIVQKNMRDHLRLCTLKRCKNFRSPRYGCNVQGTHDFIRQHELHRCVFTGDVLKQIDDLIKVSETSAPSTSPADVAHDDGDRGRPDLGT